MHTPRITTTTAAIRTVRRRHRFDKSATAQTNSSNIPIIGR